MLEPVKRLRAVILAVAAVGTVLGGLAGYLNAYRTIRAVVPPGAGPAASSAVQDRGASTEATAILVLPFGNQTGDPARAHVGESLSLALTEDLVAEAVIPVVPPLLAQELGQRGLSLKAMAREARVRYLLQGGVSADGQRVRVSVTLADTSLGQEVWSARLEGTPDRLLSLQDELTSRVRTQVLPRVAKDVAREASRRGLQDMTVEDLLQQERALAYRPHSLALQQEAERLGRAALARSPGEARALLAVAKALWLQVENHGDELGLDDAARARRLAEAADLARRAREAGSDSVTVEHVLSDEALARGDVESAHRFLSAAIERRPSDVNSRHNLATFYERTGRLDEAIAQLLVAEKLPYYEPPAFAWTTLAWLHLFIRQPEQSVPWARRAVADRPQDARRQALLALALAAAGDQPGARAASARARELDPQYRVDVSRWRPWIGKEAAFTDMVRNVLEPAARLAELEFRR